MRAHTHLDQIREEPVVRRRVPRLHQGEEAGGHPEQGLARGEEARVHEEAEGGEDAGRHLSE